MTLKFSPVRDWSIQDGDHFVVSGSLPQLGSWQMDQPLVLSETHTPIWEGEVSAVSSAGDMGSMLKSSVNMNLFFTCTVVLTSEEVFISGTGAGATEELTCDVQVWPAAEKWRDRAGGSCILFSFFSYAVLAALLWQHDEMLATGPSS